MKHIRPALFLTFTFVVLFGFAFPGVVRLIAMVVFRRQANGSLVVDSKGQVIGSELIGQSFSAPQYFHPRPSAAGDGYDAANSGGTNLGPTSDKLINGIHKKTDDGKNDPSNFDGVIDLAVAYRKENGLAPDAELPADAATRSASGLDPDITPANADLQAPRVAAARRTTISSIEALVLANTSGRFLGIYGEPAVNVLLLNRDLDKSYPLSAERDRQP